MLFSHQKEIIEHYFKNWPKCSTHMSLHYCTYSKGKQIIHQLSCKIFDINIILLLINHNLSHQLSCKIFNINITLLLINHNLSHQLSCKIFYINITLLLINHNLSHHFLLFIAKHSLDTRVLSSTKLISIFLLIWDD